MADRHHIDRLEKAHGKQSVDEGRDQQRAERADRLERFIRGEPMPDIWKLDLFPLLDALYTRYQRVMVAGDNEARGGLRFAEDFQHLIAGTITLGQQAMKRIAERRFGKETVS